MGVFGTIDGPVSRDTKAVSSATDRPEFNDTVEERKGEWMQTSTGGRFFPLDVRATDFNTANLANGMALDCRYGGQGRVDRYYSVAEHTTHLGWYSINHGFHPAFSLAVLLHDGAEAFLNDLTRAVKHSVGEAYEKLEDGLQEVIFKKYGVWEISQREAGKIKELDRRIVPLEKEAIMRHKQPWAYDQFEALEGVVIRCWAPPEAKRRWLNTYDYLCGALGRPIEDHGEL